MNTLQSDKSLLNIDESGGEASSTDTSEPNPFSFYNFLTEKQGETGAGDRPKVTGDECSCVCHSHARIEELESEVARLLTENKKMKQERKVKEKKDRQEIAALEQLVHSVEQNLTTTQKCVKEAEDTCVKQAADIKRLKSMNKELRRKLCQFEDGPNVQQKLEEQVASTTNSLKLAATQAETEIKSLLKGVDHVRFLCSILESNVSAAVDEIEDRDEDEER